MLLTQLAAMLASPSGCDDFSFLSGGIASLNHWLQAAMPPA
jgi:hypothetical protein